MAGEARNAYRGQFPVGLVGTQRNRLYSKNSEGSKQGVTWPDLCFYKELTLAAIKSKKIGEEAVGVALAETGGQPGVVAATSTGPTESGLSLWATSDSHWHWCYAYLRP